MTAWPGSEPKAGCVKRESREKEQYEREEQKKQKKQKEQEEQEEQEEPPPPVHFDSSRSTRSRTRQGSNSPGESELTSLMMMSS